LVLWSGFILAAGWGSLPVHAGGETDVLPKNETALVTRTYTSKRGKVVVETYKKTDFDRFLIHTTHYQIYSELKPNEFPPQELGMLMEAVFEQYCKFFDVTPDLKGEHWQIEMYATPERFQQLLFHGANGVFYEHTRKAHSHRINGPLDWTLKLMVHEATHQFHALSGVSHGNPVGTCSAMKFPFVNEGTATFCEGIVWDPRTETVKIGAPLPGRSAHAVKESKDRPKTFQDYIMADLERDECCNLMMFLIHRRTAQAAQLLRDTRPPEEAWKAAFGRLEPDAAFWKDYEAFCKLIADEKNAGRCKSIYFTSWPEMLKKHGAGLPSTSIESAPEATGQETAPVQADTTPGLSP
jgi:hypothetical protein